MHQIATRHALTGTILTHLEELRNEKEKDAYKEYVKTPAKKPVDKEHRIMHQSAAMNLIETWDFGIPLSRSIKG
eukprot:2470837-Karenia_brevis.AAC.1